jgi:cell division protein ZapA
MTALPDRAPKVETPPGAKSAARSDAPATKAVAKSAAKAPAVAPVVANILGREFKITVPESERAKLTQSVEYTNRKMEEVKASGKVVGNERIAILAALNIAHELLHAQQNVGASNPADLAGLNSRLEQLAKQLEAAMGAEQTKLF